MNKSNIIIISIIVVVAISASMMNIMYTDNSISASLGTGVGYAFVIGIAYTLYYIITRLVNRVVRKPSNVN